VTSVMWFRRDLRLSDNPALEAAGRDGPVVCLFVLDDALRRPSGAPRLAFLYRSLRALDEQLRARGGALVIRSARPEEVVPEVVRQSGADSVHVSADFGPYGAARDRRIDEALDGTPLVRTGSAYAVAPGRVTKPDGKPYRVYSPFYRAWRTHGWRPPAPSRLAALHWAALDTEDIPTDPPLPEGLVLPPAGEEAALAAWQHFKAGALADYPTNRNRPDLDATSRISVYLKYGALHPRTLLADLSAGDEVYRKELGWREFYAAVVHFWPESARQYFQPQMKAMDHATGAQAQERLAAWQEGWTGYPMVDAGMRQLRAQAWMHNRVRMIVASFLVKDLHLEWTAGARHFMRHLVDGELASNQHGWQWTAGTGTDPAPYYRVFNPVKQGLQYDPDGAYVRRWVPELRGLGGAAAHEPWKHGGVAGYPDRIVDHDVERKAALAAYNALG
jgi:deoxyribodipyrimidine photo-lyase